MEMLKAIMEMLDAAYVALRNPRHDFPLLNAPYKGE